jgi:large subunit ribosomal protein L6
MTPIDDKKKEAKKIKVSRVGRKVIPLPAGVKIEIDKYNTVTVSGPNGKLTQPVDKNIHIKVENDIVIVEPDNSISSKSVLRKLRAFHGLYRNLVANMIQGVSGGFEKKLEVIGVGYKAEQRQRAVMISVGYSHQIYFVPPPEVSITAEPVTTKVYAAGTPNQYLTAVLTVKGIDKQQVGQVAAKLRAIRPPDPYKSKGIRYATERVALKAGKSGSK